MTLRDKIMDEYWVEFILSGNLNYSHGSYESAYPLEANFWIWFMKKYLKSSSAKRLEDYLKP